MSIPILNVRDILDGGQGSVYATLGGRRMCMFHTKNVEAKVDYEKKDVAVLNRRARGNKKVGEKHSGKMTVYTVESNFRKLAEVYKDTGEDVYWDMQITNEDKTSRTGSQIVTLLDCNFDSISLAKLDADSTELDEDMDFTFEDWRLDKVFDDLDGLY